MKNVLLIVLLSVVLLQAQAGAPPAAVIMLNVATDPTQCVWPTGATFTNAMQLCAVKLGAAPPTLYYALNGSTTFLPLFPTPTNTGVASFNGRTGNVTLITADITGTGIGAKTSVTSTATTTLQ